MQIKNIVHEKGYKRKTKLMLDVQEKVWRIPENYSDQEATNNRTTYDRINITWWRSWCAHTIKLR